MNNHQIELCLAGTWPTSILVCPMPLTSVGRLILMAFDDKTLTQANKLVHKDFENYVRYACSIQAPNWPLVGSLAVSLGVDMSKPKVNEYFQAFPFPW